MSAPVRAPRSSIVLLAAALTALAQMTVAQPSPPGQGRTLVTVSATAWKDGHPVTDLHASEVEVRDAGVPQPLVGFEFVDTIAGEAPEAPGAVVLVLDDLGIAPEDTAGAVTAALALVDALGPADRLAIANPGPFPLTLPLSADKRSARNAIRQFLGQRGKSRLALSNAQACRDTVLLLKTIEDALDGLAGQPGDRRAVLVVSDGGRMFWGGPAKQRCRKAGGMVKRIVSASVTANAPVYGVDVRGARDDERQPATSRGSRGDAEPVDVALQKDRVPAAEGSLDALVSATGGTLNRAADDVTSSPLRLVHDSRQYYRLTYPVPGTRPRDGGAPRRIEVRVHRSGVEVRARQQSVPR